MDPERTRLVLITLAEEMAVCEAGELLGFGGERRMAVGPLIVNQRVRTRFTEEEVAALQKLNEPSAELQVTIDCALAEFRLSRSQDLALASLGDLPDRTPIYEVPRGPSHEPDALLDRIRRALLDRDAGEKASGD